MVEGTARACARTVTRRGRGQVLTRIARLAGAASTTLALVLGGGALVVATAAPTPTSSGGPATVAVTGARLANVEVAAARKPPSKPSVKVSYPRSGEVRLSWAAPKNNGSAITRYVIQRKVNGTWKTVKTVSASARSWTATRLPNGTTYQLRVRADNKVGGGAWTSVGAKPRAPRGCHPSYGGPCVPIASDVDCAGGSGNGPKYVKGPVYVLRDDPYRLDADGDRVACER